jgi:hypothetical protein
VFLAHKNPGPTYEITCISVSVRLLPSNNFRMLEPLFMKLGMYDTWAHLNGSYFINSSPISNTNITASQTAEQP